MMLYTKHQVFKPIGFGEDLFMFSLYIYISQITQFLLNIMNSRYGKPDHSIPTETRYQDEDLYKKLASD